MTDRVLTKTEPSGAATASEGPTSQQAELELVGIAKKFETKRTSTLALTGIDLAIGRREFVSVIGRSGCGKTTLLRTLAGLVSPSEGEVRVQGRGLWRGNSRDPEVMHKFGVIFQDANLFPWYTVEENIALPLRMRGEDKRSRLHRAHELAELVGLTGFERSYPRELSGGMRQRTAIARALSYRPEILLMDEPFGALDALTRERMNLEVQSIATTTEATVVFVTHDITEAVFLADRVVLLSPRPGRIKSITDIALQRPRELDLQTTPQFQDIVRTLRHQLYEDEA
ncbi:MAG: ATP-binding cassette domain-containing protein [Pseudonocardiaceae bacterium]|nr:ATP-binding cassette domain-containing protein [Pseudonocardiaceae bacterium]